jgi:hypothetical protein
MTVVIILHDICDNSPTCVRSFAKVQCHRHAFILHDICDNSPTCVRSFAKVEYHSSRIHRQDPNQGVPKSVLWIRIRSDPKFLAGSWSGYRSGKNHCGSGHLRIRKKFEVKLLLKTDKILEFFNKNAQYKNFNFFSSKKVYILSFSTWDTHKTAGNTKVKSMLRILEKIHVGSETASGSETNRKVGSGS